jgi:hypothetical protein
MIKPRESFIMIKVFIMVTLTTKPLLLIANVVEQSNPLILS